MNRFFKKTLLALTSLALLTGCAGGGAGTSDTTDAADSGTSTQQITAEPAPVYPEIAPPTDAQIAAHERLPLWPEGEIPYLIEDDEKGLQPTIRAYLCEDADAAVVIFPGGGYFQLSEDSEGVAIAEAYNDAGYSAFVVNYRYEPYDGRAILADGQRAVQYVRYFAEDFGIDPDKIALCGFSAGGHLSVMVAQHPVTENLVSDGIGATRSTPDACILAYPVTTLGEGTFYTMPPIFLGDKETDADAIAEYSYPYAIDKMPPTFIFYSVKDEFVNFEANSKAFADAMTKAGGDVVIREYADGGHGIGLGTQYEDYRAWHADSVAFLSERGF
ncbi:MAG: alpha/beta hydrolase [Clostridia bacterium]|nr:alpha/beta hydrolase [Clostridia bacterium]